MAIDLELHDTWTPVVITGGRWKGRVGILDGDSDCEGDERVSVRFTTHVLGPYREIPIEWVEHFPGVTVEEVEDWIGERRRSITVRNMKRYGMGNRIPAHLAYLADYVPPQGRYERRGYYLDWADDAD